MVYLQQWVESGRRRAEIDDPTRFATIDKSIPVSAPVDAVFEVLVDPAMLAKWLDARVSIDARVGGRMDVLWSGGEHVGGEIVLSDQPHHVVWHWWDADKLESEDDPGMITVMTWSLKEVGGQTELTIVDPGYDREQADDQYMAEIEKDWDTFLKAIPIALDRI